MKKILVPALLALAAAGCAQVVERAEFDELSEKVDKYSAKSAQTNDTQTLLYEEVVKQAKNFAERVAQAEMMVRAMEDSVKRMEDRVKTLQAQVDALSKTPGPAGAEAPAVPARKLEDILQEIEVLVTDFRSGKVTLDDAATRFKPVAAQAVPRLLTELRESLTRVDYARQLETVLSRMPSPELKVPLREALRTRGIREASARVIGAVGDRELSKLLEEYLAEQDEDFKLSVGDALVRCRNASGIPLLLACLKSDQGTTRTIAISALKKINRGMDMGYRAHLSAEQNAPAVKAWEEWSDKFAAQVFE